MKAFAIVLSREDGGWGREISGGEPNQGTM
jgi:hypothetical protein